MINTNRWTFFQWLMDQRAYYDPRVGMPGLYDAMAMMRGFSYLKS